MKNLKIVLLAASVLFAGCGTTSHSVMTEEEFERVKNGEMVIVNNRQSHGLLGDLIDSTYKTVTGTK